MFSSIHNADICIKENNITFHVCEIQYEIFEDNSFVFTFIPNYSIIDCLENFEGIPGIKLEKRKEVYTRSNVVPVFIQQRVPQKSRVDLLKMLEDAGLDYYNPIEYMLKTNLKYSGDNLFILPHEPKEMVDLESFDIKNNNIGIYSNILVNLAKGNDVYYQNKVINDSNRSIFYSFFSFFYNRQLKSRNKLINEAISKKGHVGRKKIDVDKILFDYYLNMVNKKEITAKEAASKLGISIDKYYRFKKEIESSTI